MSFEVFSRRIWRKERNKFIPNPGSRCIHVCYCETAADAREVCAEGPANKALAQGREHRNLSFYEFTAI
jgi:hypothetical protein